MNRRAPPYPRRIDPLSDNRRINDVHLFAGQENGHHKQGQSGQELLGGPEQRPKGEVAGAAAVVEREQKDRYRKDLILIFLLSFQ